MEAVERSLASIRAKDGEINAFTAVLEERARATAKKASGPLKGVQPMFDAPGARLDEPVVGGVETID